MRSDVPDITQGQVITAQYLNSMRDSAGARDVSGAYYGDRHGGFSRLVPPQDPNWFLAKVSGNDIPAYGVGVLDGYVTIEDRKYPLVKRKGTQTNPVYVVNGATARTDGEFGPFTLAKTVPTEALLKDGEEPDSGDFFTVDEDTFTLKVDSSGTIKAISDHSGTTVFIIQTDRSSNTPWIEFTPTQTFSTSDDAFSATIDAVHGTVPDDVDATVTINNTKNAFSGDTSSLGVCANYDSVEDAYFCIQLGCPPA